MFKIHEFTTEMEKLGYREKLLMEPEFVNFVLLANKSKVVIEKCIAQKYDQCTATVEIMELWFPGVVTCMDGKTMYNDIDLDVQCLFQKCGYPIDDVELTDDDDAMPELLDSSDDE